MTTGIEPFCARVWGTDHNLAGAGILVSPEYAVSCAHVVATALGLGSVPLEPPPQEVLLDFPLMAPEQFVPATVVNWGPADATSPRRDIATLRLHGEVPGGCKGAVFLTGGNLYGRQFRALGFPVGRDEGAWVDGEIKGTQASGLLQVNVTDQTGYVIEPGFSGAAVWQADDRGVVGMVVLAEVGGPQVALLIPVAALLGMLPAGANPVTYSLGAIANSTDAVDPATGSNLAQKLVRGGAPDFIVTDAKKLRAKASAAELKYQASDFMENGEELEALRDRLQTRFDATRAFHQGSAAPAVAIWRDIVDRFSEHAAVIDQSGLLGQDPDLLLGEICEMSDQCRILWE